VISPRKFQRLGVENVYSGRLLKVNVEHFRHADGEQATREIVRHQGAVGIVAHDKQNLWLVRQPREAVNEPDLLEIPAGRLDVHAEHPLAAAQRELAEEIGRAAEHWQHILTYYSSPGFTDERVYLFLATDLYEANAQSEENERIEVVKWPLSQLKQAIGASQDAKTLIGLLWLAGQINH
jgi:8-oxo-dGTP pyrophosphatase MutT (NUDIX family)